MREYRRGIYARLSPAARSKEIARATARVNKQRGRLTEEPCEVCGTTEGVEMHHDDHARPLDVRWVCRAHHPLLERSARNAYG